MKELELGKSISGPAHESPKFQDIQKEMSKLPIEASTKQVKYKYDPEADTIVMIKKDLAHNDDLKRVTFESE